MEISSHYYALLALCRTCGMDKITSYKVAYASQFVDDGKINCITPTNAEEINNISTCHSYFKIKTFNYQAMLFNTVAFHFFPCCDRDKSFTEKLVCKKNNSILKGIIDQSLIKDPEVFGMLMHVYADTFSHHGFSGLLSKQNDIENEEAENLLIFQDGLKSIFTYFLGHDKIINKLKKEKDIDDFITAYGHAQVGHYPDIPYLKWSYNYASDRCNNTNNKTIKVDNTKRFENAFKKIEEYILLYIQCNFSCKSYNPDSTDEFFEILKKRETTKKKIKSWRKYLLKHNYFDKDDIKELYYDEKQWLEEIIVDYDKYPKIHEKRTIKEKVTFVNNYQYTSWYKFIKGVEWYKKELIAECAKNGLDIKK